MIKQETKFKISTFIKYILIEPWVEKIKIPNVTTISSFILIFSILLRNYTLIFISSILLIIINAYKEYRAGKHIGWYRERKFKEFKEAKKKIKKERENKVEFDKTINA